MVRVAVSILYVLRVGFTSPKSIASGANMRPFPACPLGKHLWLLLFRLFRLLSEHVSDALIVLICRFASAHSLHLLHLGVLLDFKLLLLGLDERDCLVSVLWGRDSG